MTELVGHVGGVSDLVVVGKPTDAPDDPVKTVIGKALFATGRPVLMAQNWMPETLEGKVLIGWNRSIQAGRGVTAALPFLQRARSLGFSIKDCRVLLSLYEDRERSSADVKALAKAHLAEIVCKIAELESLRAVLTELVDSCAGNHRPDCPILDDLAGGDKERVH